ncbi:Cytoskeleton protein RodZ [Halomicronema hongdechloris C2206]|uniref:Cytoskeleton protein RodZ n=1 Tax=Halomicronema hongdechloris C2206 TaxID=1641165 RepID=A0A1Z3HG74_9CYAN|nr:RodZ domain-containing protein [Halomicronema hongdechloris]ASC69300.1 Cytoskeleton protein RodZ [Halomicronema hongdechloris C2206]
MAKLVPAQVEQLREIGAYLRQLRQQQGRTLEEVATQIFIRPALLHALEDANAELLPEPVFVQGFIRRYGDALGINGIEVASQFSVTPVAVLPDPAAAEADGGNGIVDKQTQHGLKVLSKADPQPTLTRTKLAWLGGGIVAIAAIAGIWGLTRAGWQWPSNWSVSLPEPSLPDPSSETASEPPEPTSPDPADSVTISPAEETPAEDPTAAPVTVQVELTAPSWMRVTVDGETIFEGIMGSGEQETWSGDREVKLVAGNAGGIELSLNGSEPMPLGDSGDVTTLTLTPTTDLNSLR